jgi:DNA modification methylase
MNIPNEISIDLIEEGERGRTEYPNIEQLSQSVHDNGLIQPIVLVPILTAVGDGVSFKVSYGLDAGGRRLRACKLLGYTKLYHATTSEPGRPGFVLKGEDQATPLKRLFTEIAENLDREDMPWRDEVALLTKAWRLTKSEKDAAGERILMRDFGSSIGVGYHDLQAAVIVHDDLLLNPERYKDCTGMRAAYTIKLKSEEAELTKLAAIKSISVEPLRTSQIVLKQDEEVPAQSESKPAVSIPLTSSFFNVNSLQFMQELPDEKFDHVITDPDYGVSVERLEASVSGSAAGVAQYSIEESLKDMYEFIDQSYRLVKPNGFLVFWYDLDHHEKLQTIATKIGWAVQRWPLIWHKTDYRSNAAPQYNTTKNMEYVMLCRKPKAVLVKAQNSSIYQCATGLITKELGHPFAKPYEVWQWLYNMCCLKGQTVYDPFVGRGSSAIAGAKWGLRPVGSETNPDHYHGLLHNLQTFYRKELGSNVSFT